MNLKALQHDFRAWLVDGGEDDAARFDRRARPGLLVYQNNYRSQLVACLSEAFERLHAWLGDEAFLAAAIAHIDAETPTHWTLDAYPSAFPTTMARLYPDDPEVAELAWMDWALARAFTAADAAPLTSAAIAQVDWDRAGIVFTPSLVMAEIATNAAAIWSALAADEMPPPVRQLPETASLLIWRDGFTPRFRTIDPVERGAVERMLAGGSFTDLCAALVEDMGETGGVAQAGALLGQWVGDGLIVGTGAPDMGTFDNVWSTDARP
jgi:hypothetical protein